MHPLFQTPSFGPDSEVACELGRVIDRLLLNAKWTVWYSLQFILLQALVARTYHPPFSNFLLTNLFSIKFLYFFIISSLFPHFNLFVSIFMQSYANNNLHVSTLHRYYLYRVDTCKLLLS